MIRIAAFAALASLASACAVGALGAPCDVDNDCNDGLTCDQHDHGGSCQRAHVHDEPDMPDCSTDDRDDEYALGLRHAGAWATVEFVGADPAPPQRGDNTWTVRVLDAQGGQRDDVAIDVDPFMPDHGHGSTIRCDVEPGTEPGTYVLAPVDLFMPGLWEVTLHLAVADAPPDEVMFAFCVDP